MDPHSGLDADATQRLESFVLDWLREHDVPGASVVVVDGDDVVYADGFGARDLDSNAPATPRTLYGIGSCTKSFTAIAVLQLVSAGDLSLSDPVSRYVPRFEDAPGGPVTVEELLTHSSGIPSDGYATVLIRRLMGAGPGGPPLSSDHDYDRYVERGAAERLTDGEHFFYYNSGYEVLGEVVEAVDGRSYATYVRQEILDPLGMNRSTFSRRAVAEADDAMTPYYPRDGDQVEGEFPYDEIIHAAGGLLSSVTELARYLRMHMGGGSVDGESVLDADLLAEMHTPRSTRQRAVDGTEQGYGYGVMVQEFLGDTLVGHGGSVGVSTAWFGFLADRGLGAAVLTNTTVPFHPMDVGPALLAVVEGESPTAVPRVALEEKLDAVTGEYESRLGAFSATVEESGGSLTLSLGDDDPGEELALTPDSLDPGEQRYTAVSAGGWEVPVEFRIADGDAELLVRRWRLHRT